MKLALLLAGLTLGLAATLYAVTTLWGIGAGCAIAVITGANVGLTWLIQNFSRKWMSTFALIIQYIITMLGGVAGAYAWWHVFGATCCIVLMAVAFVAGGWFAWKY